MFQDFWIFTVLVAGSHDQATFGPAIDKLVSTYRVTPAVPPRYLHTLHLFLLVDAAMKTCPAGAKVSEQEFKHNKC
jgi:hypothetical protein